MPVLPASRVLRKRLQPIDGQLRVTQTGERPKVVLVPKARGDGEQCRKPLPDVDQSTEVQVVYQRRERICHSAEALRTAAYGGGGARI